MNRKENQHSVFTTTQLNELQKIKPLNATGLADGKQKAIAG